MSETVFYVIWTCSLFLCIDYVLFCIYDVFFLSFFTFIWFFIYLLKTYYDACSYMCFYLQSSPWAENVIVGFPHS